ncbi:hypothetical protein HNR46_002650 [Haloferula luteola]|uniref:Uncharacterized protein n=1 Tax=Haloferula luteola TaxID=595692 RepID=A0A840V335_9BACT|nr:hypothetical protein [Haloferula luteola]MBB5352405.1 hypothetical protein [Haloferula luteola]
MTPKFSSLTSALMGLVAITASADQILLTDGSRLTGEVVTLDREQLSLRTPLAQEDLGLKLEGVREVNFPPPPEEWADQSARVVLINGDVFPCELKAIGDETITVNTAYSSPLDVPRRLIRSLQVGLQPRRILYDGPQAGEEWSGPSAWRVENGALISLGRGPSAFDPGSISSSFSLQFQLKWARTTNLEVYFCSASESPGPQKEDRYRLQIRNHRLRLDRQSSRQNTFDTLGEVPLNPADFPQSTFQLEIRVDRDRHHLKIQLDDAEVLLDAVDRQGIPEGSKIVFNSLINEPEAMSVGPILLRAWNPIRDRHPNEERGDPTVDALIDIDGQRFGGKILGSQADSPSNSVEIQTDFSPSPLHVPMDRVSTLFFCHSDEATGRSPLLIGLPDTGLISAESCHFENQQARILHPLLGELTFRREALRALARRQLPPEEP